MAEPRTVEDVAVDYRAARKGKDDHKMARLQNEEATIVLLTVLANLASYPRSFIHRVALKGGILMAGELGSPRTSGDIDTSSGRYKRLDERALIEELKRAGREYNLQPDGQPERTPGGTVIHLRFDSLTDAGTAKVEVSVREDLVFAVRDAFIDVTRIGVTSFSVPALAEVELVAEKLRAISQRAQPRDLFDLHLYLVQSNWHLDPKQLRQAVDAKLENTRHKKWRAGLWRANLTGIEQDYEKTLLDWVAPEHLARDRPYL